ncbi:RPM1-interacting protein 4-like [Diospyros lotus]|uniref:RPM1-interacting protein 4-like n=1 Tax=Diospyros lotus TaxID=55363 RepID=UPI002253CF48|nr:RPM1-interacting protein 4-like [Diospyros lotus]
MAQQGSHVPKFGNWDSDNIPYTVYFENARKERSKGVRMNPNDPEENAEAFIFGRGETGNAADFHAIWAPVHVDTNKSMSVEKHHREGLKQHNTHRRNTHEHQKSGNRKSTSSESGNERSNSDHSLQQNRHPTTRSAQKKNVTELNSSTSGFDRLRSGSGSNRSDDILRSYNSASVPKFGAWDETDPKSGEGFTVIFNKVKEEKQIAAAKLPMVSPQPSNYTNSPMKKSGSKICCCLFSNGSD